MPDTGLHLYMYLYEREMERLTEWDPPDMQPIDDPLTVLAEIAAGSVYDHGLEVGTGLFAPLSDTELERRRPPQ